MGLNGNQMLQTMKRLSEIKNIKQVKPLSYALFPGYHCPLMGAMLTIKEIEDSVMVVIGPDECAYYTQLATAGRSRKANGCQIVSVVLNQHDVTFGCQEKMDMAFQELMEEFTPKIVYLVTTCVVEVIGDDIEAMAEGYKKKYDLPVIVVHAENFKTDDHLPGIEHTLRGCIEVMKPQQKENQVNVLGLRLGDFTKTEVWRMLQKNDISLGLLLPGKASADSIATAPRAKCNIVVHSVGLPLAKEMEQKFGIPYVVFERYADPDRILSCYQTLFDVLEKELPEELLLWHESLVEKIEKAKEMLQGKTYISGNTALSNEELHSFLAERLNLIPLLLQVSDWKEESEEFRQKLLHFCDPYVTRAANLSAIGYLYPLLKPDFNIGAGNSLELQKQNIVTVRMKNAYDTLGLEVSEMVLEAFLTAEKASKLYDNQTEKIKQYGNGGKTA